MKKEYKWLLLVVGVLALIAGFYMLSAPLANLVSLAFAFSFVMLFNGIAEIVRYFSNKATSHGIQLFNGIITVLLALALLSSSWIEMAAMIPFFIAFWVLFGGISKLIMSFAVKKVDAKAGSTLMWLGILGIVAGIIMAGHPYFTGISVAYLVAFTFIYQGIASIVMFFAD